MNAACIHAYVHTNNMHEHIRTDMYTHMNAYIYVHTNRHIHAYNAVHTVGLRIVLFYIVEDNIMLIQEQKLADSLALLSEPLIA